MNLLLYERPAQGDAYLGNITQLQRTLAGADTWEHSSRAIGGNWLAEFTVARNNPRELSNYYDRWLGCRIVARERGIPAWEGIVYQLDLILNGTAYRRTLNPEWWHNKVKVYYQYPAASDGEQGSLTYYSDSINDSGQDFRDWAVSSGDAKYKIVVTNTDGTETWGFLGNTVIVQTRVYVYQNIERTTGGWNGEYSTKTPATYEVIDVAQAGEMVSLAWAQNDDSVEQYGIMPYIYTLPATTTSAATSLQTRALAEMAWPRSRMVGGLDFVAGGVRVPENALRVTCAGFWATLNWTYWANELNSRGDTFAKYLVNLTQFVTPGATDPNPLHVRMDAQGIPQRVGDLLEDLISRGDADGNVWQGGVYPGRLFDYEQAPTTVGYFLRNGQLFSRTGRLVNPALARPGFLLRNIAAPSGGLYAPTDVWDDPQVSYVEEVLFTAPDRLRLRLFEEEELVVLQRQLERAAAPEIPHRPIPPYTPPYSASGHGRERSPDLPWTPQMPPYIPAGWEGTWEEWARYYWRMHPGGG